MIIADLWWIGTGTARAGVGTSGWPLLQQDPGPWPTALAVSAGEGRGIASVLSNPALLGGASSAEVVALGERGIGKTNLGGILAAMPLRGGRAGALAASAVYYSAGDAEVTWFDAVTRQEQTKTVSAQQDLVATAAYGRPFLGRLWLGAALKGGWSRLAETVSTRVLAVDIGARWRSPVPQGLTGFGVVRNLGVASSVVSEGDRLPLAAVVGASYTRPFGIWQGTLAQTGTFLVPESRLIGDAAVEFGIAMLRVFGGYHFGRGTAGASTVGGSVAVGPVRATYAFLPGRALEDLHRVALSYRFGTASHSSP